jgi:hypothetical protein
MDVFSLISAFIPKLWLHSKKKTVYEFLHLEDVAVTSLVNGTVCKYTGQGFCSGMSEKKSQVLGIRTPDLFLWQCFPLAAL